MNALSERTRFGLELGGAIGFGALLALVAYGGLDYVAGRILEARILEARAPAAAPIALAACPQPAESEQLHIVVTPRDGKLVAECMMVGSRGTYRRSRHGMPEPRP